MDGQPPPTRPVALGGLEMADKEDFGVHPADFRILDSFGAVSYTHLTLPTILLV